MSWFGGGDSDSGDEDAGQITRYMRSSLGLGEYASGSQEAKMEKQLDGDVHKVRKVLSASES